MLRVTFFANQVLGLVLGVVAVAEAACVSELKFEELVAKFALVTNVIAQVEIFIWVLRLFHLCF